MANYPAFTADNTGNLKPVVLANDLGALVELRCITNLLVQDTKSQIDISQMRADELQVLLNLSGTKVFG